MDLLDRLTAVNWLAVISAAVPLLSLVWRFTRTPRSRTRLDALVEVHDKLPPEVQQRMVPALETHLDSYLDEMQQQADRKIDGSSIAALVFVAIVGGLSLWGIGWLSQTVHWVFWIPFGVVAFFLVALLVAGMGKIYKEE